MSGGPSPFAGPDLAAPEAAPAASVGAEIEALEARIEAAQDRLDGCRQAMALSRAAIVVALVVLLLAMTLAGALRTPTIVFAAVAALIGGTVWFGASRSSFREAADDLATLDRRKDRLIDEVAARNGWRDLTPTMH